MHFRLVNNSNNGKVWKQHLRASAWRLLLSIAANDEPESKMIESPPNGKASLGYGITIYTAVLRYHIPLARCQATFEFTRWSHAFAESVSLLSAQSVVLLSIAANWNLIESPSKGESQPRLRSIYHSYHSALVYYMDYHRRRRR